MFVGFDCSLPELEVDTKNSVALNCSLPSCKLSGLVHQKCLDKLETQAISALANAKGRAREWSAREREKVGLVNLVCSNLSEFLQNLWHDRGYELIYRLFPCRCGHGFLRRGEEEAAILPSGARKRKKSEKERPKLNVCTKLVSQKNVGQYFQDGAVLDRCQNIRKLVNPPPKCTTDESDCQVAQAIPGLFVEPQYKPMRLNIDLPTNLEEEDGKSREDKVIFNSEDDTVELSNQSSITNSSEEQSVISQVGGLLRQENNQLREKILEDRRMYEECLQFMTRENEKLKAINMIEQNQFNISVLKMKHDLENKEKELGDKIEAIEVFKQLLEDEKKCSSFLRGLIFDEFLFKPSEKMEMTSPQSVNANVEGSQFFSDLNVNFLLADCIEGFESDQEVNKTTEKLYNFVMTQNKTMAKIACLEHDIQGLHVENLEFKKQVNNLRKMLSFFDMF